ncbi:hypothetical protein [Hyalangium versicolor]|uniref:hypothetical protein n=1 Tax=Hyalangium versicolor TaxID=2861190 RepID=UPI001CCFBCF0|nr:hypothetical protein [Hyalangium versicolor]
MDTSQPGDDAEFEKLKLLFDYTKFHVGIYLTVVGVLTGIVATSAKDFSFHFNRAWLISAIVFIVIAGIAGGVLLSSMCHERRLDLFWNKKLGPFGLRCWPAKWWASIEHTAFWVAIGCALCAFFFPSSNRGG